MIARSLPRGLQVAIVVVLAWLVAAPARAHGLRPGVLSLVEQAPGTFALAFTEPMDTSGASTTVTVALPEHCRREPARLDCGPAGLRGRVAVDGLAGDRARVVVLVRWLDGRTLEAMLTARAPVLDVGDGPPTSGVAAWVRLGAEHVLGGLDHLAFVLGLVLVVGARSPRRLALTLTAFTLAHSLTLALGATGLLVLRPAPVEATIAASVMLVAREATHQAPTLTRRAPWLVALAFGLVHGLGFAGALRSALPADPGPALAWGLVWLGLGIELGQLLAVVVAVAIGALAARLVGRHAARLRTLVVHALGGLGAWWLVERTVALVSGA